LGDKVILFCYHKNMLSLSLGLLDFEIDYCFSSETALTRGIWMSFFDTEEAHAVMLAYAVNGGPVDQRSSGPGSSPPEAGKGKEQAQSTCPARPVDWELVIPPWVLEN
jgi:hypothetical protein